MRLFRRTADPPPAFVYPDYATVTAPPGTLGGLYFDTATGHWRDRDWEASEALAPQHAAERARNAAASRGTPGLDGFVPTSVSRIPASEVANPPWKMTDE